MTGLDKTHVFNAPAVALTVVSYFMTKPTRKYIETTFDVPGFVLDTIRKNKRAYVVTWRRK